MITSTDGAEAATSLLTVPTVRAAITAMSMKPPIIVAARKPRQQTPSKAKAEAAPTTPRIVTARALSGEAGPFEPTAAPSRGLWRACRDRIAGDGAINPRRPACGRATWLCERRRQWGAEKGGDTADRSAPTLKVAKAREGSGTPRAPREGHLPMFPGIAEHTPVDRVSDHRPVPARRWSAGIRRQVPTQGSGTYRTYICNLFEVRADSTCSAFQLVVVYDLLSDRGLPVVIHWSNHSTDATPLGLASRHLKRPAASGR